MFEQIIELTVDGYPQVLTFHQKIDDSHASYRKQVGMGSRVRKGDLVRVVLCEDGKLRLDI